MDSDSTDSAEDESSAESGTIQTGHQMVEQPYRELEGSFLS